MTWRILLFWLLSASVGAACLVTDHSAAWDARGLMLSQTDGAGHFILSSNDAAGNQIILTNRNGNKWQFTVDAANRVICTTTPLSRSNLVVFNHQGLPTLLIDQAGQQTTNTLTPAPASSRAGTRWRPRRTFTTPTIT